MTPKEKVKELILKFAFKGAQHEGEAKTFSLISVDEVLDELFEIAMVTGSSYVYKHINYWLEVRKEIEKL